MYADVISLVSLWGLASHGAQTFKPALLQMSLAGEKQVLLVPRYFINYCFLLFALEVLEEQ